MQAKSLRWWTWTKVHHGWRQRFKARGAGRVLFGRSILMGNPRPRPRRLGSKLLQIREGLGLSQSQMLARLGLEDSMHYGRISQYENDQREPTLMTLLAYARVAGVHLEDIVSDDFDLPAKLPGNVDYRGLRHKPSPRRK